jgi:hypothetical protein
MKRPRISPANHIESTRFCLPGQPINQDRCDLELVERFEQRELATWRRLQETPTEQTHSNVSAQHLDKSIR